MRRQRGRAAKRPRACVLSVGLWTFVRCEGMVCWSLWAEDESSHNSMGPTTTLEIPTEPAPVERVAQEILLSYCDYERPPRVTELKPEHIAFVRVNGHKRWAFRFASPEAEPVMPGVRRTPGRPRWQ